MTERRPLKLRREVLINRATIAAVYAREELLRAAGVTTAVGGPHREAIDEGASLTMPREGSETLREGEVTSSSATVP